MSKKSLKNKLEEESKIKFRNQEMKLSEAKIYLERLKAGEITINLDEREKAEYTKFMESMKRGDKKAIERGDKPWFEKYDEKEYLSFLLGIEIGVRQYADKQNYCEKHGHEEVKGSAVMSSDGSFAFCSRCGTMYDRVPTQKELKDWNNLLRTPMTI